MKTYLFPFFACFLFLFTACQQEAIEEIREPKIREVGGNESIRFDFPSNEDFRLRYDEDQKTISYDIGEYNLYPELLESARLQAGDIEPYHELQMTGINLDLALFSPYTFDMDTWEAFTKDVEVIYTPTNGDPAVSLAAFQGMPFRSFSGNGMQVFSFEENLIDLFVNSPGVLSFKFSFTDKPDDEIKLTGGFLRFVSQAQTITYYK